MFKELYPLAQSSPIVMLVSVESDLVRVAITQKADKKGTPLAISVTGTPDELDTELPTAIAEAAGNGLLHSSVANQVRAQLAKGAKPEKAKNDSTAAKPAPAPGSKAARKAECIDDYVKLATDPKTKEKLNREYFIEKAKTGRNFERLFGNWTGFKAAAEKAIKAQEKAGTATPAAEPAAVASDDTETAVVDDQTQPLPLDEPVRDETPSTDAAADEPAPQPWTVVLSDGTVLFEAEPTRELVEGEEVGHAGTAYIVTAIDAEHRAYSVRPKFRDVATSDGAVVGRETRELEAGDQVSFGPITYTVARVDADRYIVLPPPKVRKVVDDEGSAIGEHTGEIKLGDVIEFAPDFKVVRVTDKAIFVELAGAAQGA